MRNWLVAAVSSLLLTVGGLALLGLATAPPSSAATRIEVPTSAAGLGRITTAPNGTIWFVEEDANKVGHFTPGGAVAETAFPADFDSTTVKDLAVAPDNTVWVLYQSGRNVAHLDANGTVAQTGELPQFGQQIRVGADGTVFITISYDDDYVVTISNNTISEFPNSPACEDSLAIGADGAVWCRTGNDSLTRLNAGGGGSAYPAGNYAAWPYAIAPGPVGSIWFGRYFEGTFATSPDDGEVGYLNAATSQVVAFNTGSRTAPNDLVQGPDGNMWFTSIGAAKGIGHIAPNGTGGALTALGGYQPRSLTFGTDGAVYATDAANNVILRAAVSELQVTNVDPGEGSVLHGTPGAGLGKVRAGKKPIAVKQGKVGLRLTCAKDAAARCAGTARLTTNAKKKPATISKAVKYSVKPGKKKQLGLKLTPKGLKVLKKHGVTKVRLELLAPGSKTAAVSQVVKVKR